MVSSNDFIKHGTPLTELILKNRSTLLRKPYLKLRETTPSKTVTREDVRQVTLSLPLNKAPSPDIMNTRISNDFLPFILGPLTEIINCSILTSSFLNKLLTVVSKVCEKIALSQFTTYLLNNNRLTAWQRGNKKAHSTETLNIYLTDCILEAMDRKKLTVLVLLYLSKAFDSIRHQKLLLKLSKEGKSPSTVNSAIEKPGQHLRNVAQWCCANNLLINPSKAELLFIGTKQLMSRIPGAPQILQPPTPARDLGVILDPHLTYDHTSSLSKTSAGNISKLQSIQNFVSKVATNSKKFDHVTPLLRQLNWLPVKQLQLYKNVIMTYKCLNDLAPQYLSDKFMKRSSIHARYTRKRDSFQIPICKTATGPRTFTYRATSLWNSLVMTLRIVPP
ncbi:hypothetical protein pdam_00013221 [Pocillopora damicornis]|uniref:Reverse transcriptase domain-containing protein n=1 Tax=Pocillopora damicornis TaxID=46731 RepID=A0A3M6UAI5_POCDA|nr:hypothetical protein pdam_00013221 [Pocillopora damicornis]